MNTIVKYCLVLAYLVLSGSLFAQSFISEDKLWRTGSRVDGPWSTSYYYNTALKFRGDSILNDTAYTKLYISQVESISKWELYGLWRETKDMKIYSRSLFSSNEKLVYNFSFEENDTINTDGFTFQVDSVVTKLWGGKMRKHWYLNDIHAEGDSAIGLHSTLWVEDVGQINFFPNNLNVTDGATLFLLCFQENGQQVYQNPEYNNCFYTSAVSLSIEEKPFKIYPNPASGKLFVQVNQTFKEDLSIELYNATGQLVKTDCLDAGANQYQIDVSTIRSGIYVVRLLSASGKYAEEIIIKN